MDAATLAACDYDLALPVDYVAERDVTKPEAQRGRYRVAEDTMVVAGARKSDPVLRLRRVFVWSSAREGARSPGKEAGPGHRRPGTARAWAGGRHYPTVKEANERVAAIARERRVKAYLRTEVGTDATGKPTLTWHFDATRSAAEAATDGWYALLTNLGPAAADAAEVLRRYKGQEVVERRYGNLKGPLAVAPMFLKSNRHIEALISVICLALLIFSLVERAVRLAISPALQLAALWAGRAAKPTGRLIFGALSRLRLIPATKTTAVVIPEPPPLHARLLELLDVDPRVPR